MNKKAGKYMNGVYQSVGQYKGRYLENEATREELHKNILDIVTLLKIKGLTVRQAQMLLKATSEYIVESSLV